MSGFTLKLIAIITMAIDHIGYVFFPNLLWLRVVGRLAFPIFAYMAAEGAIHTRNRKKYLQRLLLWGLISEIPYDLMCFGTIFSLEGQNVCWTLAAGVLCVWLSEKHSLSANAGILLLLVLTTLLTTDYLFPGVLCIMILHHYIVRGKPWLGVLLGSVVLSFASGLLQLFCVLSVIPLALYNGKRGPKMKYLFYLFYPVHMLVIWGVALLLASGGIRL